MGYLDGFGVIVKKWFGVNSDSGARVTLQYPEEVRPKPERFHGRHVLNRYEDGMEKCIGCELCAGVCPAKCIYVRGADNDPDDPTSPGERFGYVYEINYLRCIHCDLCVEACPTEAITETKLFEFSFTNRDDAIYTKNELLVGDDGRPQQLPWENWDGGFDPARDTSGWMRATAPQGDHNFKDLVAWAGELGYGVRPPERAKVLEETGPVPSIAHGHDDHDHGHDHDIAHTPDEGAGVDAVEPETIEIPSLDHAAKFDAGDVTHTAAETYEAAGDLDAAELIGQEDLPATAAKFQIGDTLGTVPTEEAAAPEQAAPADDESFETAARFNAPVEEQVESTETTEPAWFSPEDDTDAEDAPYAGAAEFNAPVVEEETKGKSRRRRGKHASDPAETPVSPAVDGDDDLTLRAKPSAFDVQGTDEEFSEALRDAFGDEPEAEAEPAQAEAEDTTDEPEASADAPEGEADDSADAPEGDDDDSAESADPAEPTITRHAAGHFDAPEVDEPEPKKKRRFRR